MSYVGAEVDWDQPISIKFSEQEPSQTTRLAHAFAFSEKIFQQGYYRQAEFILYQILKLKPSFDPAYAFYFAILQHQDRHLDQVGESFGRCAFGIASGKNHSLHKTPHG